MKRYLLLIILCLADSCAFAFPPWFIGAVASGGASVDTCTGSKLFAAHFENSDNVTVGGGCSVGDTTITKLGITYSAAKKSDGEYSTYSTVEDSSGVIDSTNMNISITGTWCGDISYQQTIGRRVFTISSSGPYGYIVYNSGGNTIRANYGTENHTSSATFQNDTWTRVCTSWDASQSDGADKLAVKVGANQWESSTIKTLASLGSNPATYYIVGGSFQYYPGYIDNVKIYSDYAHEE